MQDAVARSLLARRLVVAHDGADGPRLLVARAVARARVLAARGQLRQRVEAVVDLVRDLVAVVVTVLRRQSGRRSSGESDDLQWAKSGRPKSEGRSRLDAIAVEVAHVAGARVAVAIGILGLRLGPRLQAQASWELKRRS